MELAEAKATCHNPMPCYYDTLQGQVDWRQLALQIDTRPCISPTRKRRLKHTKIPKSMWMCAKNSYKPKSSFHSHYSSISKVSVTHWQTELTTVDLEDKSQTVESRNWIASHQPERAAAWKVLVQTTLRILMNNKCLWRNPDQFMHSSTRGKTRRDLWASPAVGKLISLGIGCSYQQR